MQIPAPYHTLQELPAAPARGRLRNWARNVKGAVSIVRGDVVHNTLGAYHVLRLWHVQKVHAGLIDKTHPWCTGRLPGTDELAWLRNVVFRTQPAPGIATESDEHIMQKVGGFLAEMVKKSAQLPEIPHGPERRMPHVVNYLHGVVHCNGLWLLFNDFAEAKHYFADAAFRREFVRLVRQERREVTLVFRQRKYDPIEYAYFSGFMMAQFPWFANVNGPGKKVMWGNPAPYPAMNIITGNWMADVDRLRRGQGGRVRPAVEARQYFLGRYGAPTGEYTLPERLVAFIENEWVRRRGFNAGLFFIDRKKIDPRIYDKYTEDKATLAAKQTVVPNPLHKPRTEHL
ncbi:hypothetical protein F0P96_06720 [Hymenobacter busanensis]|uniref:Uncharacterized protein n=1 Tax=Hymenobacter busanensis TaxID=2607656 RepID=A0A7L5A3G4_9BACT|nr:hypothetical protein [Hymenobacter busanensis]KAA9338520.1 hypothetical protein F0P96_06720 [Hymenobacter busanensis]QHJ09052.1 hypothetical protein GUY19_17880 [Hymenobacter busanensis]